MGGLTTEDKGIHYLYFWLCIIGIRQGGMAFSELMAGLSPDPRMMHVVVVNFSASLWSRCVFELVETATALNMGIMTIFLLFAGFLGTA